MFLISLGQRGCVRNTGARHLTLDDNWNGWNWKKTLGMGKIDSLILPVGDPESRLSGALLRRSLVKALKMEKHAAVNRKFDAMFSDEVRDEWLRMIRDWEKDGSKPDPFTHTEKGGHSSVVD